MASKSASRRPREVMAGAPMRTPPGASALTSPTTAFLFSVMCTRSHAVSILFPFTPCSREDERLRCAHSLRACKLRQPFFMANLCLDGGSDSQKRSDLMYMHMRCV